MSNWPPTLPSEGLTTFFVLLVVATLGLVQYLLAGAPSVGARGSICALLIICVGLGGEILISSMGLLSQFEQLPPAMAKLLVPLLILNLLFSCCSKLGGLLAAELSTRSLVGFQAFRVGPELFLHAGYLEGALPRQMTWPPDGRNFDVLIAALALGLLAFPQPLASKSVVWAFGLLGTASLLNILFTAMVSLAHPIRDRLMPQFELGLEAVTLAPYVLLPGCLFQLALCGQLLLFRRLLRPPYEAVATSEAGGTRGGKAMR